ncbi:Neuron navigator 3 [Collichthys lucidus]|uniref:Neuron navigator 3 n=1 Tax=Collichthys lucidus TaxID=240159 RepID=A0A4U5VR80_COLLU|nr:Neuron navigator 3 [Collichthys lucidus]
MPVVGVASKLRQPSAVGTKPVHTALPIPSAVRAATSQGYMARQQELRAGCLSSPHDRCADVLNEQEKERLVSGGLLVNPMHRFPGT